MQENPFTIRYKKLTNSELLEIIDHASEYQEKAVDAARLELDYRNLSEDELVLAQKELQEIKFEKDKFDKRIEEIESKTKKIGWKLIDTLHPVKSETPSASRYINSIAILLSIYFLYKLYIDFNLLKYMLFDFEASESPELYLLIDMFVWTSSSITAVLLFLRKPLGWKLSALFFSYQLGTFIVILFKMYISPYKYSDLYDSSSLNKSPIPFIIITVFYAWLIYILSKVRIRYIFGIRKKTMYNTILIGGILGLLIMTLLINIH